MLGISFVVSPIRDHAFFKKSECECLFGNDLFQLTSFTTKRGYFAHGSRTSRITCKPSLTGLKKLLRLFAINALGDAFTTAQLGNGFFTA